MNREPDRKERLRRAHAHLRAAKKYSAKGNAAKARAHFGRAEHYGSEFGGFMDSVYSMLGYNAAPSTVDDLEIRKSSLVDYTCKDPKETGTMWLCQECNCVEFVIYAENSGDKCVAPGCKGTRENAKGSYGSYRNMYGLAYETRSMLEDKMKVVDAYGNFKSDKPEVAVPRIAKGPEEPPVPDPNKMYSLWICQEFDHNQYVCDTIRLLWRVPNKNDLCANPRCTGLKEHASSAYLANEGEYRAKFNGAVEAVRRVVRYNEPLPMSADEKTRALGLTAPEIGAKHAVALKEARDGVTDKQQQESFIGHRLIDSLDASHHAVVIACLDELRERPKRPELRDERYQSWDSVKTKALLTLLAAKYNETKKVELGRVTSTEMTELLKMFIPRLVVDCVDELRDRHEGQDKNYPDGLFRELGNKKTIDGLFDYYKSNGKTTISSAKSNDIAGLLKKFISQLQTPLMGECIAPQEQLELRKLPAEPREPDQQTETPTKKEPLPVGHKLVLLYMLPLLRAIAEDSHSKLNDNTLSTVLVVMTNKSDHLHHIDDNRPKAPKEEEARPLAPLSQLEITNQARAEKEKCISFIRRVIFQDRDAETILRSNP